MRTTFKTSRILGCAAVILLAALSVFAGITPAQAITSGSAAPASSYTYVAEITVSETWYSSSDCTGTLIGPRWVLTAAHCVLDSNGNKRSPSAFKVSVGHEKADWDKTAIAVNRVERHPNYPAHLTGGQPWPADFALLQLSQAVSNTPLALAATEPGVGTAATFAGWGCTGVSTVDCHQNSAQLNVATSTVQADSTCGFYGAYLPFDMCTARPGPVSTIRHGDSGGPMIKRTPLGNRLAGVISGLWTNYDAIGSVPYVLGWIHDVTGIGAPAESNPVPPPTTNPPPANPGPASYTYTVYHTGALGLNVRPAPNTSGAPIGHIPDGGQVTITCQVHGQRVLAETDIWDAVVGGGWVYDEYINGTQVGVFSIRQC